MQVKQSNSNRLIDPFAQFLTRFEVGNPLRRHIDLLSRFGITAEAWRAVIERKAAEAANLDTVAAHQRFRHRIKNHLHGKIGIFRHQLGKAFRQPGR